MTVFVVDRSEAGQTLAEFVRRRLSLSWRQATNLVKDRRIKLGDRTCSEPTRRLRSGEKIELASETKKKKASAPPPRLGFRERNVDPIPEGISVVYSDQHVLVVEKPAALTTMRDADEAAEFGRRGKTYLPATLADVLPRLLNDSRPIIAVHRLDRDTTGLVAFARTPEAASHLGRQFRAHTTSRTYRAICRGTPKSGRVESWIVRDRGDGRRGSGAESDGQRAVTHIQVIKTFGDLSLVKCRLETGRTHQVRIHLGELGCPLAGERIYDRPLHGKPKPDPSGAKRIALHAASLGFVHPDTGKVMTWSSPIPDDMKKIIEQFSS